LTMNRQIDFKENGEENKNNQVVINPVYREMN